MGKYTQTSVRLNLKMLAVATPQWWGHFLPFPSIASGNRHLLLS